MTKIEEMKKMEQIGNRPNYEKNPYDVFKVGDRVAMYGWTDINPGTVVEVKRNGAEIHVRADHAELAAGQKPEIIAGGFAGHCTNQHSLEWDITENPNGGITAYTLRKWRGIYVWTHKYCNPNGSQAVGLGWRKFYDFNF